MKDNLHADPRAAVRPRPTWQQDYAGRLDQFKGLLTSLEQEIRYLEDHIRSVRAAKRTHQAGIHALIRYREMINQCTRKRKEAEDGLASLRSNRAFEEMTKQWKDESRNTVRARFRQLVDRDPQPGEDDDYSRAICATLQNEMVKRCKLPLVTSAPPSHTIEEARRHVAEMRHVWEEFARVVEANADQASNVHEKALSGVVASSCRQRITLLNDWDRVVQYYLDRVYDASRELNELRRELTKSCDEIGTLIDQLQQ